MDFDHLLVRGQVIKLDNSSTLYPNITYPSILMPTLLLRRNANTASKRNRILGWSSPLVKAETTGAEMMYGLNDLILGQR